MSSSSDASLGSLRLQAQQRSDLENNQAVSDPEWNQYLSQSYKELYDLLVGAYGNDYELAIPYQFSVTNSQMYNLPDGTNSYLNTAGNTAEKFYKLLGVDLQTYTSPTGWLSLRRFEFIERNQMSNPNTSVNNVGLTNLRYRISGNSLYFIPTPSSGQAVQIWYVPAPTSLQFQLSCSTTIGSTTVGVADTTGLTAGMNVYGNPILGNTTITSVGSTSIVISQAPSSTRASAILSLWDDSTTMDGIAGWEEYVIIDSAIKAQIKQENDYTGLAQQKAEMKMRIEAMAEGRDIGQAHHVSDAMSLSGDDDWGNGMGSW